jgi:menaquinone-dependent protoporphyrinogen IX oxidase
MKTLVVYASVTGFTRRYAEWIAQDLQAETVPLKALDLRTLAAGDLVIFGGSLHAVGIAGLKQLRHKLGSLSARKVIVFATGASPSREGILQEVTEANFSPEERAAVRFFYLRGGFDYSRLDLPNKLLMTLLKWKIQLKRPEQRNGDERGMLAAFARPADFTKREYVRDLVECARSCACQSAST